jgi:large subunit ribosomal protein L14
MNYFQKILLIYLMIQVKTKMPSGDNSGAKQIECIKVYKRRLAKAGQPILVSIKKVLPRKKVQKGDISPAVLIHSKKEKNRKDGSLIRFSKNTGILVNPKKKLPIAKRIIGPVSEELQFYGYNKVISMAKTVL